MNPASLLFRALVAGYVRTNAMRAAVTLIAVALGVATAYAIDLANATAIASFARSVDVVASHVNLQVFGSGAGFDERALLRVQMIDGVQSASPVVEGELVEGVRRGEPDSGEIVRVLGIDLTRASVPASAQDGSRNTAFDLHRFIDGDGILISDRISRTYKAPLGGMLHAFAGGRAVALPVMGVMPPNSTGVDSSVAFVDIATAQELFGSVGRLDRIDVIADQSRINDVRDAIAQVLPPGARVVEPHTRLAEIRRMLASFQMNLSALADVALLVGMYLIYNAVAISVVQRKSEIGTLRALGAKQRQVFGTFVAEGALYGVVGSLIGLALGFLLARFAVGAVQTTVSTLYVASHADHPVVTFWPTFKAFALGTLLAMISAAIPAFEASRTAPARVMRGNAAPERRIPGFSRVSALFGVGIILLAFGFAQLPAIGNDVPLFGYIAGVLLIAGASLCTPFILAGAVSLVRVLPLRSAPVTIATAFLRASPRRFSVAIASLAVAVAMMMAIAILVGSFRSTVVAWTQDTLGADLYVKTPGAPDASFRGYLPASVPSRIERVPGVVAADVYRGIEVQIQGRVADLGATDVDSFARRHKLRFIGNVNPANIAREMHDRDVAVISEPFSTHFGLGTGDSFVIPTPEGETRFRIAAVFNDYSTSGGSFFIDRATYERLFHDDSIDSVAVYVQPNADDGAVRTAIERALLPLHVDITTNGELRAFAISVFDRTFAITNALYLVSMAIAILGVVSTLFALVLERRVDIGLLRYVGLTRAGVRSSVLVQALIVGIVAGALGIVLGIALAADLIYVINRQSFGWLIEWRSPGWFYAEAFAMVVIAALIAAIYPSGVAARIRTAEVLRVE